MAENSQLSGNMKNSSTDTSSTDASSEAIGKHENEIVPHKISNHDKLVQTMVMVDGEWINVNDTNDQANMKDDMNKVNKKVVEAQKGIVEAKSAADSAAKAADSAVSASVVNSDAITAQSAAISEAKSAISSATAEIQQTAATAASDAAKIRADVAQVQNEVNTAKAANSASVEALKSDVSAAKQDIQAARQANENVAKQLDDYTKQAQAQGKTIKDIQDAQNGYTATLADVKGNVSKISDAVDGLSASLKDDQDNVATIKAKADELSATLNDHDKNIAQLTASAKKLSSTLEDAGGRLSKVEQTASTLVNEFADQQGHLNRVEQTAQGTEQTVANQQGQINSIQTDVSGVHQTITGQVNQIADINVTLNGLSSKYEGVSGDLNNLKSQAQWVTVTSAVDLNNVKTPCHEFLKGTVTNAPNEVAWWYLTVEGSDSGRITQTVIADQSNNRYTRRFADSWSAWVRDATQTDITALSGRITTNSTQITQNKQAIALKADQSSVNNLSGEVSQNKAQLKVQAGQISSKVSSEDFSALNDRAMQNRGTVSAPDFNSLMQAGYYTVTMPYNGKNYPTVNRGTLEVSGQASDANGRLNQKYVSDNNVETYVRQYNANTKSWTAWIKTANQNDINTLDGKISKNSTAIDQTNKQVSLKADQTEVNNAKEIASQNSSRLDVMADEIKQKVDGTAVNSILDSKGYATMSYTQTLVNQTKSQWDVTATNLTDRFNSLQVSIDGLQSTVKDKADQSQLTQLSNLVQSKVSTGDFTSEVSQLSNDINARVTKGSLLSQINIAAGHTLIQSNKIYFDADSFVMSANSKAFIPSAFITNLSADKITTGTLDASKLHVKNFSADDISGGTLSGVVVKSGIKDEYFQTTKSNIYWVHNKKTSLIGTDTYINPGDGLVIADEHTIMLTTWWGAMINDDGSITNNAGAMGYPKIVIDQDGLWDPGVPGGANWEHGPGSQEVAQWVSDKEYTTLTQGKGFYVRLDDKSKNSEFVIQKDNKVGAYFGSGDHGDELSITTAGCITFNAGLFDVNGEVHIPDHGLTVKDLHVTRWLGVDGSKNSIVNTSQGTVAINAYETAEYYFGDIGEGQTNSNGIAYIGIEKLFNETVNTTIPYHVFITAYGPGNIWVDQREHNRFVVKSDQPNLKFSWEIKAKRKGYEHTRLQNVDDELNHMETTS